jgi:hypothetical protein
MIFEFKASDFQKVGKILGVRPKRLGNNVRFELENKESHRKIALEIYPNIRIGSKRGNVISVYTSNAHLQVHFCSGYVISNMLKEVTFIGEHDGKLTGLIVEREGGCSIYANVDRKMLSGDFTQLGPEVMLSGIALSLTESILPAKKERSKRQSR